MSNSFVFYETFTKQLKYLDVETRCRFYDAIAEYGLYETEPDFKGIELSVWLPIQEAIDASKKKKGKHKGAGRNNAIPSKPPDPRECVRKVSFL